MQDTREPPLTVNVDEIEVSQILLKLPVLFSESESRRYCFRVNWGSQRRRSNTLRKPVKDKASGPATHVSSSPMGSQKNLKRKRESGDTKEEDSDLTKAFNFCLKERKHDNHVASTGIQMIGRKSVTVNKGAYLTTAQGGLNNMQKSKGKVVSTASKIVERKALADVSNVQGNSSRNIVHDGPKLMKDKSETTTCFQSQLNWKQVPAHEPDIRKLKNCRDEAIMTQVLRPCSGHVRGMRSGVIPTLSSSSWLYDATQVNKHEECKIKQLETEEKVTKMQEQIDMLMAIAWTERGR